MIIIWPSSTALHCDVSDITRMKASFGCSVQPGQVVVGKHWTRQVTWHA